MENHEHKSHCHGSCCCGHSHIETATEEMAAADGGHLVNSSFSIGGLDCADCANKLEKMIRKLKGVADAQVNFAAASMKVVYDSQILKAYDVAKAINNFGYSATLTKAAQDRKDLKKTVFRLSGLDCADCAKKLEKKVLGLSGVNHVVVNFGAGKISVEHSASNIDIIQIIQQAGYQVSIDAKSDTTKVKSWWQSPKVITTILSGLFLVTATLLDWLGGMESAAVILYTFAIVSGGYHVTKSGLYALRTLTFDTNILMVIAVCGAIAIKEWSEGATVVFLFALGNALQSYTVDKTRNSIRALMDLAPREALIKRKAQELRLPIEKIVVGDLMLVKPGERIAMDGSVLNGTSAVNQAAITGESMPIEKGPGDTVYAGTINQHGALEIVVTKLAEDSTLARIMNMVEEAQAQKAPMQQFIDVFAKYYTPMVIVGALAIMFVPWLVFNQSFSSWFYKGLVLLVISCPCALVISTPVSIVSAIGNASRYGVLIKGGAYLEQLGKVKAMAFDKTGTLTQGRPVVTNVVSLSDCDEKEILGLAAAVEKWSEHPLAQAIIDNANNLKLEYNTKVTGFKALVGRGAQADIDGKIVYVGSLRLFEELGHSITVYENKLEDYESQGKTVMFVGTHTKILGLIAVADITRETSRETVQALKATGVEYIAMLTGDNYRVAQTIADKLGLDAFYSELMPEDKVKVLKQIASQSGITVMIGDGVNDAPALAAADIGIAMGVAGSDAALETADIALMADDLRKLPYMVKLSRKTIQIIKQNIVFSLAIKAIFVVAALLGIANLWMAVVADTGAALLVTLNGMRLARTMNQE